MLFGLQVDISSWRAKDGRVRQQIRDICSILCGLVVASDYRQGQQLISGRDFKANAAWFQNVFEVGRRYKIMNPGASDVGAPVEACSLPASVRSLCSSTGAHATHVCALCHPGSSNDASRMPTSVKPTDCATAVYTLVHEHRCVTVLGADKMRSEYGKLMYLLMDSAEPNIQELVEFRCVRPLKTVYSTLGARRCRAPLLHGAKVGHQGSDPAPTEAIAITVGPPRRWHMRVLTWVSAACCAEEGGALKMLEDPLMQTATAEILVGDRPRYDIQRDIKAKVLLTCRKLELPVLCVCIVLFVPVPTPYWRKLHLTFGSVLA